MREKQWLVHEENKPAEAALTESGIPALAAKVLSARGFDTPEKAESFTEEKADFPSPMLLRDMDRAVARIKTAVGGGEKIAVYGDYDVDGITSVSLLYHWLGSKGADCCYYIPERQEDGYGVSRYGIDLLKEKGVSLIITVDIGITAVDEVDYAAGRDIDIIITDHHENHCGLPAAYAIVNPLREGCDYPAKQIAGVFVTFLLVWACEGGAALSSLLESYADLVAVGTIADVMPLTGINRAMVARGLKNINECGRIGFKALFNEAGGDAKCINAGFIGFSAAPRINAAGRMGNPADAVELLLTEDCSRASELSKKLCELNRERQKIENAMYEDVVKLAEKTLYESGGTIPGVLVLSGEGWHQGIIGIVASRLSERYACPVFLIAVEDGTGKGSARSFYGTNIYSIMEKADGYLLTWGGHEFAAGFTIEEKNIDGFKRLLEQLAVELTPAHIYADAEISEDMLTPESIDGLSLLEPHGACNPPPVFLLRDAVIGDIVPLGWGKSLRMTITKGCRKFPAFFFGMDICRFDACDGDRVDALFRAEIFESKKEGTDIRLIVSDIRVIPPELETYRYETELYLRFREGGDITKEEACLLMPRKLEFIALLRHLKRNADGQGHVFCRVGPMCRKICREEHIKTYAKLFTCMDVLKEMGRLDYIRRHDILYISLSEDKPLNLNKSEILGRLKRILCCE